MLNDTPLRAGRDGPTMTEGKGYAMRGSGATVVPVRPAALWEIVMDERRLAAAIPGAETLRRVEGALPMTYAADVSIGVGPIRGTWVVTAEFAEAIAPAHLVLFGGARGPLGNSWGEGWVDFAPDPEGTRVEYAYAILIGGTVGKLGGRLLDAAAGRLIAKFFDRLARAVQATEAERAVP